MTIMETPPKFIDPNLRKFCGHSTSRHETAEPFVYGEHEYATDRFVCLRRRSECNTPPVARLCWKHDQVKNWKPWPSRGTVVRRSDGKQYVRFCKDRWIKFEAWNGVATMPCVSYAIVAGERNILIKSGSYEGVVVVATDDYVNETEAA